MSRRVRAGCEGCLRGPSGLLGPRPRPWAKSRDRQIPFQLSKRVRHINPHCDVKQIGEKDIPPWSSTSIGGGNSVSAAGISSGNVPSLGTNRETLVNRLCVQDNQANHLL